jgi:propanol-preferring alcohol dehydrogenase
MKAVLFTGNGQLESVERRDPVPSTDEVVIRICATGICGSDVTRYRRPRSELGKSIDVVGGHDNSGEIVELGSEVSNFQVADRVLAYLRIGCMECSYCISGFPAHCKVGHAIGRHVDGAYAEYMSVPSWAALPLPSSISHREGAVISCNLGTAFSAFRKLSLDGHTSRIVAVFGIGPVGLLAIMLARNAGCQTIGIDISASRLKLAQKLGADVVIDASIQDVIEAVRDVTAGVGCHGIIECSGASIARSQAIEVGAPMSHVVLVGNGADSVAAPISLLKSKEMLLQGSVLYRPSEYREMIAFLEQHRLPALDIVAAEMALDEIQAAFRLVEQGISGKILLMP